MLTLWGRANSINVQKPLLALLELGVEFRRFDAGMEFGVVATDDYFSKNPNRKVPVLDDDGFLLWESNVVTRYLCAKYGDGRFYPADLQTRFDAERWMDWQQTTLLDPINVLFWALIRGRGSPDANELAAMTARAEQVVAILDERLSHRRFVCGDDIGMADFALAPTIHRWLHLPLTRVTHAHVERWYGEIMSRQSAREVLTLPLT